MKITPYDILYVLLGLEGLGILVLTLIGIAQEAFIGILLFVISVIFLLKRVEWEKTSEKNIIEDERLVKIRGKAAEAAYASVLLLLIQFLIARQLMEFEINDILILGILFPSIIVYFAVLHLEKSG